jgi:hypothetical protein
MLKQEEVAFMKAISTSELSATILRELRKAIAAKRNKALGPSKAKVSSLTPIELQSTASGAESEAQPFRQPPQQLAGKRKADGLSSSGG